VNRPNGFDASPQAPVRTTWATLGAFIGFAFGAGVWATWMSLKVESLENIVTEMRADLRDIRQHYNVSKYP